MFHVLGGNRNVQLDVEQVLNAQNALSLLVVLVFHVEMHSSLSTPNFGLFGFGAFAHFVSG